MLELKNICFSADGKQILKDINLRIDDAKFIVITGPPTAAVNPLWQESSAGF